eukprot:GHVN01016784.1.p1 GENE.GHVN01016784.1~~GHVN01016784.1.p1  ORF type:complete len:1050 (+),score=73.96 GHVN01016784.1:2281-5430(+)
MQALLCPSDSALLGCSHAVRPSPHALPQTSMGCPALFDMQETPAMSSDSEESRLDAEERELIEENRLQEQLDSLKRVRRLAGTALEDIFHEDLVAEDKVEQTEYTPTNDNGDFIEIFGDGTEYAAFLANERHDTLEEVSMPFEDIPEREANQKQIDTRAAVDWIYQRLAMERSVERGAVEGAIRLMRECHFEAPFIAVYRKDEVPGLFLKDLWQINDLCTEFALFDARRKALDRVTGECHDKLVDSRDLDDLFTHHKQKNEHVPEKWMLSPRQLVENIEHGEQMHVPEDDVPSDFFSTSTKRRLARILSYEPSLRKMLRARHGEAAIGHWDGKGFREVAKAASLGLDYIHAHQNGACVFMDESSFYESIRTLYGGNDPAADKERDEVLRSGLSLIARCIEKEIHEDLFKAAAHGIGTAAMHSLMERLAMPQCTPAGFGPNDVVFVASHRADTHQALFLVMNKHADIVEKIIFEDKTLTGLAELYLRHKPRFVGVSGNTPATRFLYLEIRRQCLHQETRIEYVDDEVARLTSCDAFEYTRSLGRTVLCPLLEFACCADILSLALHPHQALIPRDLLRHYAERAFINVVNTVCLDPNRIAHDRGVFEASKYICGLGPKRAALLQEHTRKKDIVSRNDLKDVFGECVFVNCSGFFILSRETLSCDPVNLLDTLRIHPENYPIAEEIARRAIQSNNVACRVSELLACPEKTLSFDFANYTAELEVQTKRRMEHTVSSIRDVLLEGRSIGYNPFGLLYRPCQPSIERLFRMLCPVNPEALLRGKMFEMTVVAVQDDRLLCKQQGLTGIIPFEYIDKAALPPERRFTVGDLVEGVVFDLNKETFTLTLSCRERDRTGRRPSTGFTPRLTTNKSFRNISRQAAEKLMEDLPAGAFLLRPSTRGSDFLAISLKLGDRLFYHMEVKEMDKHSGDVFGQRFLVGGEHFSSLQALEEYATQIYRLFEEAVSFRKTITIPAGENEKRFCELHLSRECRHNPRQINYVLALSRRYPGKILLSLFVRACSFEYISVVSAGFLFRRKTFATIVSMLNWFKSQRQ